MLVDTVQIPFLHDFAVHTHFLRRIAKLDLQLFPTHPDRAGDLSFLELGQACRTQTQRNARVRCAGDLLQRK
jgi:hypothetical protein